MFVIFEGKKLRKMYLLNFFSNEFFFVPGHCVFVLFMAVNGVSECFSFAVMSTAGKQFKD